MDAVTGLTQWVPMSLEHLEELKSAPYLMSRSDQMNLLGEVLEIRFRHDALMQACKGLLYYYRHSLDYGPNGNPTKELRLLRAIRSAMDKPVPLARSSIAEQCARICERRAETVCRAFSDDVEQEAKFCAQAIRSFAAGRVCSVCQIEPPEPEHLRCGACRLAEDGTEG